MDKVIENYQQILKFPSTSQGMINAVNEIGKIYNLLLTLKDKFIKDVENEIESRELTKGDLIKEAKLNITLSKFSGYDSELDIYTFQSEFEKLHGRTTTKRMLPDLFINNYLSEPALSLVKNVDPIADIWDRLKATYGDTKILLSRKIASFDKISQLSKTKEPEKLIAGISQIINLMRDLLNLASKHKIEKNLFYGEALDEYIALLGIRE